MHIVFRIGLTFALASIFVASEPAAATPLQEAASPKATDQATVSAAEATREARPEAQPPTDAVKPASSILPASSSPKDIAEARKQFKVGVKLKSSGNTEAAFEKFEQASQLDPRNLEYVTAREFARQQLVMEALQRGNKEM